LPYPKETVPRAFDCIRTKRSTPPALKTTGHVVLAGTLESDATFTTNSIFPSPID
jgi:hypothetical protein